MRAHFISSPGASRRTRSDREHLKLAAFHSDLLRATPTCSDHNNVKTTFSALPISRLRALFILTRCPFRVGIFSMKTLFMLMMMIVTAMHAAQDVGIYELRT